MSLSRWAPVGLVVVSLFNVFAGPSPCNPQQTASSVQGVGVASPLAPLAYPHGEETPLGSQIAVLLSDPAVAHAHWGIAVTAMDGTPVYGLDEAKLFRPASTAKLFTTAAALEVLGPGATSHTSIYFPPPSAEGTVSGDITLVGGGDANLSGRKLPWTSTRDVSAGTPAPDPLHDFHDLAAAVASKNVRHITGNVVASSWPWDPYPQGWAAEDLPWGYGAPVTSLSLNDNKIALRVTANGAPGSPATVTLAPDLGLYRVVSNVSIADRESTPRGVTLHHEPGDGTLRLQGSLAAGESFTAEVAIDDPPRFAAEALRRALIAYGITVDGAVVAVREEPEDTANLLREIRRPFPAMPPNTGTGVGQAGDCLGPCPTSVDHVSAPLIEDITATLKESLNLHAELMLRDLGMGWRSGSEHSPAVAGERVVQQQSTAAGIDAHELVLYDGSGLSTKDLVTPRAEAQLLAYAAKQSWFAQWKAALPVGGVDGTLASRFTEPPLKGRVFAKTGTLGESRALAGYVHCASGREMIFSILDDDHEPGSSADRIAMDRIVAAIAALN